MITFRPFRKEDWYAIENPVEITSTAIIDLRGDDFFEAIKNGVNVTAIENDAVIVVGGITFYGDNKGEAWIKIAKSAAQKPRKLLSGIRAGFGILIDSTQGVGVTSHVLEGFCKGDKLAAFLGFKKTDDFIEYKDIRYNTYILEDTNAAS